MKRLLKMMEEFSDITIKARKEWYLKRYEYYDMFWKHSYLPRIIIDSISIIALILVLILK